MSEQAFSGQNRVVVDWDGTCVPALWPAQPGLLPGAEEALKDFLAHGFEVVISSTRLAPYAVDELTPVPAPQWLDEYHYIRGTLDRAGLHDVDIWTHPWKPGGLYYVDDKGVKFDGDWEAVVREVVGG